MGLQRVGHDWATDLIWSDLMLLTILVVFHQNHIHTGLPLYLFRTFLKTLWETAFPITILNLVQIKVSISLLDWLLVNFFVDNGNLLNEAFSANPSYRPTHFTLYHCVISPCFILAFLSAYLMFYSFIIHLLIKIITLWVCIYLLIIEVIYIRIINIKFWITSLTKEGNGIRKE